MSVEREHRFVVRAGSSMSFDVNGEPEPHRVCVELKTGGRVALTELRTEAFSSLPRTVGLPQWFCSEYNIATDSYLVRVAPAPNEDCTLIIGVTFNGRHRTTSSPSYSRPTQGPRAGSRPSPAQGASGTNAQGPGTSGGPSGSAFSITNTATAVGFATGPVFWLDEPIIKLPPLPTTTTLGELIGYRLWRITQQGMLESVAMRATWMPGIPMEGVPKDHNSAGVYSFKSVCSRLRDCLNEYGWPYGGALGRVALWGTVIEHEWGYRASHARIEAIDSVFNAGVFRARRLLHALRAVYCPQKGQ